MKVRDSLKRGTVEMVILHLLSQRDMYGYELLQEIKKRSDGHFELKEGTTYPILYRLIDKEIISDKVVAVGRRRTRTYYHLREEGKAYLQNLIDEYAYITDGISMILDYREEAEK